jgi:hypothetical protein
VFLESFGNLLRTKQTEIRDEIAASMSTSLFSICRSEPKISGRSLIDICLKLLQEHCTWSTATRVDAARLAVLVVRQRVFVAPTAHGVDFVADDPRVMYHILIKNINRDASRPRRRWLLLKRHNKVGIATAQTAARTVSPYADATPNIV